MTLSDTKTFQLDIGNLKYRGSLYGNGSSHIFYFHGYGQSSRSVKKFLSTDLLKNFTVHSIGLFYHESKFPQERIPKDPYNKIELVNFIEQYTNRNEIESFFLMGYSIGARICFELISHPMNKGIFVIAPDGITRNIWYTLFSKSGIMKKMALSLARKTGLSLFVIRAIHKTGFISNYEKQLIEYNIASPDSLKSVFDTWSCYSMIYPNPNSWMKSIEENDIRHLFLFGKNDKIISRRAYKKIMKITSHVIIAEDGHNLIKEKYSNVVSKFFLS